MNKNSQEMSLYSFEFPDLPKEIANRKNKNLFSSMHSCHNTHKCKQKLLYTTFVHLPYRTATALLLQEQVFHY